MGKACQGQDVPALTHFIWPFLSVVPSPQHNGSSAFDAERADRIFLSPADLGRVPQVLFVLDFVPGYSILCVQAWIGSGAFFLLPDVAFCAGGGGRRSGIVGIDGLCRRKISNPGATQMGGFPRLFGFSGSPFWKMGRLPNAAVGF